MLTLPRLWATNDNYAAGPDAGTPTKVDPASDADGFIRGVIAAPQHVNYHLSQLTRNERRMVQHLLCQLRPVGRSTDDSSERTAVISLGYTSGAHRGALVCNLDSVGVQTIVDGLPGVAHLAFGGPLTSITSDVSGAARDPVSGRIVVIGTGGNRNCYSDDQGGTWTAGGDLGGSGVDIIWNPTYSRFQATYSGHARYSADATSWTDNALAGVGALTGLRRGIALLPNGDTVVGTASNPLTLKKSPNGGTSWSSTGSPADTFHSGFALAGAGLDYAYFVGFRHTDHAFECYRSADGNVWTSVATIAPSTGGLLAAPVAPYIQQCPDTGVLFLAAADSTAGEFFGLMASLDQGETWTDMLSIRGTGLPSALLTSDGWGVAGGRVIANGRNAVSGGGGVLLVTEGPGAI